MEPGQHCSEFWPSDIPLRERLSDRLPTECAAPEGYVRAQWVLRIIREYNYDPEQRDIEVPAGAGRAAERSEVFADIVVYRDKARKEPCLVVETKRPGELAGVKQAESYARHLGAEFHVWSNGNLTKDLNVARKLWRSFVLFTKQ
jgi:hypothetical protein